MSRKFYVRFKNQADLDTFAKKIGLGISILTKEIDYDKKTFVDRKTAKPKINITGKKDWEEHWVGMPEFKRDFTVDEYAKIIMTFNDNTTCEELSELFEQNITTKTKSIYFPKKVPEKKNNIRVIGGDVQPKYPVYVVSKNRAVDASWHTSHRLSQMGIYHYIVVEPDQVEKYKQAFNNKYVTILEMDMSYKDNYDTFSDLGNINSTGPGAARNFCWEHSKNNGFAWHWVLDDNVAGFYRYYRGRKIEAKTAEVFTTVERFTERYDNIAIASFNYCNFCHEQDGRPAYVLNTRIYSMLFIRNDIPWRWRGRYNEDTDLSLNVLKDGWCTVQVNAYLGDKVATQTIKGGNTEEFYAKEGTWAKSQMLVDMHPDVTRLVWKFGRWHHQVDYSGFKQQLHLKPEYEYTKELNDDEHGIKIVRIPDEICGTELDNANYLMEHYYNDENALVEDDIWLND